MTVLGIRSAHRSRALARRFPDELVIVGLPTRETRLAARALGFRLGFDERFIVVVSSTGWRVFTGHGFATAAFSIGWAAGDHTSPPTARGGTPGSHGADVSSGRFVITVHAHDALAFGFDVAAVGTPVVRTGRMDAYELRMLARQFNGYRQAAG